MKTTKNHKVNVQNVLLNSVSGKNLDELIQEWEYRKDRTKHKILKPEGTYYTDYVIQNNKVYAIFEYENRSNTVYVCNTTKTNEDWKSCRIEENKTHYFITI